jgi:hypothetical protein
MNITAFRQFVAMFINARDAAARYDEEPSIGTAVLVVRVAFRIAGSEHHLGRFRALAADADAKSFSEFQSQALYQILSIL